MRNLIVKKNITLVYINFQLNFQNSCIQRNYQCSLNKCDQINTFLHSHCSQTNVLMSQGKKREEKYHFDSYTLGLMDEFHK